MAQAAPPVPNEMPAVVVAKHEPVLAAIVPRRIAPAEPIAEVSAQPILPALPAFADLPVRAADSMARAERDRYRTAAHLGLPAIAQHHDLGQAVAVSA